MKLSIIVPVYNVEKYLHECLESILGQKFTDYELILVDDGSTDRCGTICDDYARKDARIRVIHRENGGLSAARNTGLDTAQGDYIAFVDADDHIGKGFLARAMQLADADETPADIIEMPVEVYYNSPTRHYLYGDSLDNDRTCHFPQSWTTWIETEGITHTYAWNKLYRSKLFRKLRFPEGRTFEDLHTIPKLMKKARIVTFCGPTTAEERYYYRFRESSITTAAGRRTLNDALRHHCPLMSELTYTTYSVSPRSIGRYFIQVTNLFIDLLRKLDKADMQDEEQAALIKKVHKYLKRLNPGRKHVMQATDGTREKVKNLTLALFGVRWHCFLYSRRWYPIH